MEENYVVEHGLQCLTHISGTVWSGRAQKTVLEGQFHWKSEDRLPNSQM